MDDVSEEGCPPMENSTKVSYVVFKNPALSHYHTEKAAAKHQGRLTVHISTITLLALFIGLILLGGCVDSEKEPSRLELTMESQAMQMAALSDRLARCEHQWQTNTEELMRYHQVAMRDLDAFGQEQVRLRASIHGMDERWTVQNEYLRNRQGQFQQGLLDLNKAVKATDGRIMVVNKTLKDEIATKHQLLAQNLDRVAHTSTLCEQEINTLQNQAEAIAMDVNAVQEGQYMLKSLVANDNQTIVGHLNSVAQNQEHLQETLNNTQETAQGTAKQLQSVDGKNDQIIVWTQTHSQRVEQLDQAAADRYVSLTKEAQQVQQRTGSMQDTLSANQRRLSEQTMGRFDNLEGQHKQLIDLTQQNRLKIEKLDASLTERHAALDSRIQEVGDTGKNVSVQVRRADQQRKQADLVIAQQLTGLDQTQNRLMTWTEAQNQQQQEAETRAQGRHAALTSQLDTLQQQETQLQQQVAKVAEKQVAVAQDTTTRLAGLDEQHQQLLQRTQEQGQSQQQGQRRIATQLGTLATQVEGIQEQGTGLSTQMTEVIQNQDVLAQDTATRLNGLGLQQRQLLDQTQLQGQSQQQALSRVDQKVTSLATQMGEVHQQGTKLNQQMIEVAQKQDVLSQETDTRFDGVTTRQTQMFQVLEQQNKTMDNLGNTVTTQHRRLTDQVQTLVQTSEAIGEQAGISHLEQQKQAQQLADLHTQQQQLHDWTQQQNNRQANQEELTKRRHTALVDHHQKDHGEQRLLLDQLAKLRQSTATQSQQLAERAAGLESLHQTLLAQVGKVDASQIRLQKEIQQGHSTTTKNLRDRSEDLQTHLNTLAQMLTRLEGRLEETTTDLDKSVKTGAQIDHAATRNLQRELTGLVKTVGNITSMQQSLQQQLDRLQTRLRDQHRRELNDLTEIKEKLIEKKPAAKAKTTKPTQADT